MTPKEIFDEYRAYLDLDTDTWVGGSEVWRKLHTAQNEIVRLITRQQPTFFLKSYSFNLVSGTDTYDLPLNARLGTRIVLVEDLTNDWQIYPINFNEQIEWSGDQKFAMDGSKLKIIPTPTSADTFNLKVWYVPSFANMLQGIVASAGTTSLGLFTTDADYTVNFGRIDSRNDYYNGMEVQIIDYTGEGQTRTINDYAGLGSPIITVDAWTTTPDTTSEFVIACPVPEDFHQLVAIRAAMHGAVKNRNRQQDLKDMWTEGKSDMLSWVTARQMAQLETVDPDDDAEY